MKCEYVASVGFLSNVTYKINKNMARGGGTEYKSTAVLFSAGTVVTFSNLYRSTGTENLFR